MKRNPKRRNRTRRRNLAPILLMGLGLFLILGAWAWFLRANRANTAQGTPEQAVEGSYPDETRVSLADAKAAYDLGAAVFLDVRSSQEFAESHIRGAINIPLDELPQRMAELDPQQWIITY